VSAGVGRGGRPRSSARRAADDKNSDPTASSTRPVNRGASCSQAQSSIRLRDTGRAWRVARAPRRGSRVRCGERERFIETHPSLATARRSGRAAGRGGTLSARARGTADQPGAWVRDLAAHDSAEHLRFAEVELASTVADRLDRRLGGCPEGTVTGSDRVLAARSAELCASGGERIGQCLPRGRGGVRPSTAALKPGRCSLPRFRRNLQCARRSSRAPQIPAGVGERERPRPDRARSRAVTVAHRPAGDQTTVSCQQSPTPPAPQSRLGTGARPVPNHAGNSRNLRLWSSPCRVSQSRIAASFRRPAPPAPHSSHARDRLATCRVEAEPWRGAAATSRWRRGSAP
jgi:hypothetical protein